MIQPLHEPHCAACRCIQETMSSHHAIRSPSLALPGFAALHCWHVVCIACGDAHMLGWSSLRSDIHPLMLLHQSEGVTEAELLPFHWAHACCSSASCCELALLSELRLRRTPASTPPTTSTATSAMIHGVQRRRPSARAGPTGAASVSVLTLSGWATLRPSVRDKSPGRWGGSSPNLDRAHRDGKPVRVGQGQDVDVHHVVAGPERAWRCPARLRRGGWVRGMGGTVLKSHAGAVALGTVVGMGPDDLGARPGAFGVIGMSGTAGSCWTSVVGVWGGSHSVVSEGLVT